MSKKDPNPKEEKFEMEYENGDNMPKESYVVQDFLGKGRFGSVYLVKDANDNNKQKVVKVVSQTNMSGSSIAEIAKMKKSMTHANVVSYLDSFHDQKSHFIVMEFCYGRMTLAQLIRNHRQKQKEIPRESVKEWCWQIISGLHFIHQNGLVHKDIQPRNMFLDFLGGVKIGDLGLAQEASLTSYDENSSIFYSSPQFINQDNYTEKTDIWSFGIVVYEMLSLRRPFECRKLKDTIESIRKSEPKPIEAPMTRFFDIIIDHSLGKHESDRYSARKMIDALTREESLTDSSLKRKGTFSGKMKKRLIEKLSPKTKVKSFDSKSIQNLSHH